MKQLSLLSLSLALAGCATQAPGADATPVATIETSTLAAYHWRLTDARDADGQRLDALLVRPAQPVQLDFLADGGLAVGNTCNRMRGQYRVQGAQLALGRMAATRMACADPQLAGLDAQLGQRLQGTLTAALSRDQPPRLSLTTAAGERLDFEGVPTPATRYGGPGETVFMEVAAQAKACPHPLMPNKQCLQVRPLQYDDQGLHRDGTGDWQPLYQDIEGYTHTPGVRNVLRLKRYRIAHPPADGSSIAYVLDLVVESETVAGSR